MATRPVWVGRVYSGKTFRWALYMMLEMVSGSESVAAVK